MNKSLQKKIWTDSGQNKKQKQRTVMNQSLKLSIVEILMEYSLSI